MTNQEKRAFSIKIFLPDGVPEGLRIVEKSNWVGQGVVCPRSRFPSAKGREEFRRTGVYVLLGPVEGDELPTVYIGEGDPVLPRLEQHNAKKDFWTSAIAFISKDANLNKAHVQYLESRLVSLAQDAKRCILDNVTSPQLPSLSEADVADMEGFLGEMLLIFPVLGLTVFEKPVVAISETRVLYLKARGVEAKGYEADQGFVVLEGSQAAIEAVPSIHDYMLRRRRSLLEKEILKQDGDHYVMTQDYTFASPSTAAGILLGRTANGRIEWKDQGGLTLKELQSAGIEAEEQ